MGVHATYVYAVGDALLSDSLQIASGGVASLEDIRAVKSAGLAGAILGRAL